MKLATRIWFFWICISSLIGLEKSRICLNMIVRNESHVIERSLLSVKDLIDYWVIVDTGSSDGTQDRVCQVLEGVPGELYERPWQDFGYNRTEALELAKGKADYILFLDADDWISYEDAHLFASLDADVYWARWQSQRVPSFGYMKPLMVKDSLPCRWEGVIHEYIVYENAKAQNTLEGVRYIFTGEGHRSKNPDKYREAARVLEEALEKEPDNSRYVFYLAESYRDANCPDLALEAYKKRVDMGGWREEIFWSLLQIGHLKKALGYSYEEVLSAYYEAYYQNPNRAEPIHYLAECYNEHQEYDLAYQVIKDWQALEKGDNDPIFFRLGWVEEYGIEFQLSIAAFYVGAYQESLEAHDHLLANPNVPEFLQKQIILNRTFPAHYLELV